MIAGKVGSGKSSLVNMLLNEIKAKAGQNPDGVTKKVASFSGGLGGNKALPVQIIDTIGVGD